MEVLRDLTKLANNTTDHAGKRYGRLTAVRISGVYKKTYKNGVTKRRRVWLCKCDCGNEIEVVGNSLTNKHTKSCGCIQTDRCKAMGKAKRLPLGAAVKRQRYLLCANGAKQRGYGFDITFEEFVRLSEQNCHYCGRVPYTPAVIGYSTWVKNGIDRVDNTKGYTLDNCVPCCKVCNRMKNVLGYVDFIAHCQMVSARHPDPYLPIGDTGYFK
jgi:hypothetical protein